MLKEYGAAPPEAETMAEPVDAPLQSTGLVEFKLPTTGDGSVTVTVISVKHELC